MEGGPLNLLVVGMCIRIVYFYLKPLFTIDKKKWMSGSSLRLNFFTKPQKSTLTSGLVAIIKVAVNFAAKKRMTVPGNSKYT